MTTTGNPEDLLSTKGLNRIKAPNPSSSHDTKLHPEGPRVKRTRKGVGNTDGVQINTLAKGGNTNTPPARDPAGGVLKSEDTLNTVEGSDRFCPPSPASNVVSLADWRKERGSSHCKGPYADWTAEEKEAEIRRLIHVLAVEKGFVATKRYLDPSRPGWRPRR